MSTPGDPVMETASTPAPSVEGAETIATAPSVDAVESTTERELPSLPAVDTSKQAWTFVLASFLVEMLLWGPLVTSGVFLKYYSALPEFATSSETKISLIGTLSLFFAYSAGFPLLYLFNRYSRYMEFALWVGLIICSTSLLIASFAKTVELLIFFQGVLPGIAAALCAFPIIRWIPEWFDKRKGSAAGVIFSGGGVGGVYMPILFQFLLDRLGYQWTLRILAITTAAVAGVAICFVHPRIPIGPRAQVINMPMPSFLDTFLGYGFFGCFLSSLLQAFGFFNVGLFLPRFSDTLESSAGAGLLSAFNVSCIGAALLWGNLSDRLKPAFTMAASSLLGCLLVLTMWGFGGGIGLPVLAPFAITFGLMTGGFTSMLPQSAFIIVGNDKQKQNMVFQGFSVARGLGAVLGPTAGAELYRMPSAFGANRWGAAGSPGMVGLVAASLAGSALVGLLFAHATDVFKWLTSHIKVGSGVRSEQFEMSVRPRE